MLRLWVRAVLVVLVPLMGMQTASAQSIRQVTQLPPGKMEWQEVVVPAEGKIYLQYTPNGAMRTQVWVYDTLTQSATQVALPGAPDSVFTTLIGVMNGRLFFNGEHQVLHPIYGFFIQQASIWSFHLASATWTRHVEYQATNTAYRAYYTRALPAKNKIVFTLFQTTYTSTLGSGEESGQVIVLDPQTNVALDLSTLLPAGDRPYLAAPVKEWGNLLFFAGQQGSSSTTQTHDLLYTYDFVSGQAQTLFKTDLSNNHSTYTSKYFQSTSGWQQMDGVQTVLTPEPVAGSPYVYIQWWPDGTSHFLGNEQNNIWRLDLGTGQREMLTSGANGVSFTVRATSGGRYYFTTDEPYMGPPPQPIFQHVCELVHGQTSYRQVDQLDQNPIFRLELGIPNFWLHTVNGNPVLVRFSEAPNSQTIAVRRLDAANNYAGEQVEFSASALFRWNENAIRYQDDRLTVADGHVNGFREYFAVDLRNNSAVQLTNFMQTDRNVSDYSVRLGKVFNYNGRYYFVGRSQSPAHAQPTPMTQLYTIDLPSGTTSNEAERAEADGPRWSVYPNPVDASSRVRFTLEQPAEVSASLYTADGRELVIAGSRRFDAGAHELPLPTFSGIGVVRVSIGGRASSQKVLR